MRASRMRSLELQAEGSPAAQSIRSDGVTAVISPATPGRWDFNSATYVDQGCFLRALPMLDDAFAGAGVDGWAVRVPEQDREVEARLAAAGFTPESRAFALGRELDEAIVPDAPGGVEIACDWDLVAAGRINDRAHGDPPGGWSGALGALEPRGLWLYTAVCDGAPVSSLLVHDHRGDTVHWYLATLPSAAGRGLARLLKLTALGEARERGCTSATSHSTAAGAAVAAACGYRRLAAVTAWVRRFDRPRVRAVRRDARRPARAAVR